MVARSEPPEIKATSALIFPFLVERKRLWFALRDELDEASEDGTVRRVSTTHDPLILPLVCDIEIILVGAGSSGGVYMTTSLYAGGEAGVSSCWSS
jgi:hypothetical protein